ncbi:MAG: Re/Si-specific NAD(P)(+) transhydrogenase subunit alpha, partial [Actinomycetota bacterium]
MGDRLKVGVPRESLPSETRVGMVPGQVPALVKAGLAVVVESDAGAASGYTDELYVASGAEIVDHGA